MSDNNPNSDNSSGEYRQRPSRISRERRVPSVVWPVILITAGVLLLLTNLGYLSASAWSLMWRFWPVLLIALGVDVLIGRRSTLGAIISTLVFTLLASGILILVLLAPQIPALTGLVSSEEITADHIEYPRDGIEEATVIIDWSSLPAELKPLTNSDNLIEGDVAYRGQLLFDVVTRDDQANVTLDQQYDGTGLWWQFDSCNEQNLRWEVGLHPDVVYDLYLDSGSGSGVFDLEGLVLSYLKLDAGSGSIDMSLPGGAAYQVSIDGGSGPMRIQLPTSSGARVELDSGSGAFNPSQRFRRVSDNWSIWETTNYSTAAFSILLTIDHGSGSITVD